MKPPQATRILKLLKKHGDTREDHYHWLRERDNPRTIEYLEAENRYAEQQMAHTQDLQDEIFSELKSRVVESDMSAPVRDGRFEYYYRDRKSDSYLTHYRRMVGEPQTETLLLDENQMAEGFDFFKLEDLTVSPNGDIIGFATDTVGNERWTLSFMRLDDRTFFEEQITDTGAMHAWSLSGKCVYYTTLNAAHRPYRLYRHHVGDDPANDELLVEEQDEAYYLYVRETDSRNFISLNVCANSTSEVHLIDANDDGCRPRVIFPRKHNVEYSIEDRDDNLYVLTNDSAVNFRLMRTSLENPDNVNWNTVIEHSEDITLNGFQMFKEFIAVAERFEGLPGVRIINADDTEYRIKKPPEIQELRIGDNRKYDSETCRVNATSLILPFSQYDCDMRNGTLAHIKSKPVGGGYEPSGYAIERHTAVSNDGTRVPIYLVFSKGARESLRPMPLLLNAYGSYGISTPLYFSSARLSLLDRGIALGFVHIRGGGEFGRKWYLDGKLLKKKNTFEDFNAAAGYLIDEDITASDRFAIEGGSAGGLVVGNYLMSRTARCRAALAYVPFVDIITTMLDDSLPATVVEYDEWGNPNDAEYYDYMKSYSPYDGTVERDYPSLYISTGLNDPRVGYWEPAKWAAKIRKLKTDSNPLLLRTDMHSGHSGKSGRYDKFREIALEYAFVIDQLLTK